MMDIDSSTPTRLSLLRGQAHCEQLKQGTLIRVASGTLSVTSHVWVENTLLSMKTPLFQSCVFCLPVSGWYEIAAQSDADLLLTLPEKRFKRIWRKFNLFTPPWARYQ